MAAAPLEGTFALEGILEGQLVAPNAQARIQEWISLLASMGLTLTLQVDGTHFTVFADQSQTQTARIGGDPAENLRSTLAQLVGVIGPVTQHELYSTLRSVETRPGTQVRTVYALSSTDEVEIQQDRVGATTQAASEALGWQGHAKIAGITLLILAALLGIASLFVDIPGAIRGVWERVAPIDVEALEVEHGPLTPYLEITEIERASGKGGLALELERGPDFPTTPEARAGLLDRAEGEARLTAHAILRGYIRCEVFDEDGKWMATREIRVRDLAAKADATVVLHVPVSPRPARLVLLP